MQNHPTSLTVDTRSERQEIDAALHRYRELPDDEKMILRLRALVLMQVNRSTFRRIVIHAARKVLGSSYRVNHDRIYALDKALRNKGLLIGENPCPAGIVLPVALDALADRHATALLDACGMHVDQHLVTHTLWHKDRMLALLADRLRRVRIAVFANETGTLERALQDFETTQEQLARGYVRIADADTLETAWRGLEEEPEWLLGRQPRILDAVLGVKLDAVLNESRCSPALKRVLARAASRPPGHFSVETLQKLAQWKLMQGDWEWVATHAGAFDDDDFHATWLPAAAAFLQGQNREALTLFGAGLKVYRKRSRKRSGIPESGVVLLYALSLLAENDEKLVRTAQAAVRPRMSQDPFLDPGFRALSKAACLLQGSEQEALSEARWPIHKPCSPWSLACLALAEHLVAGERLVEPTGTLLQSIVGSLRDAFPVPARIVADVLAAHGLASAGATSSGGGSPRPAGLREFGNLIHVKPAWERRLDTVIAEMEATQAASGKGHSRAGQKRLAFFLNVETCEIEVAEQTWQKQGRWSAGRSVALRRLQHPDERLRYLTDADRKALYIREESTGWYADEFRYVFDVDRALPGLVGHPAVFDASDRKRQLELVAAEPELVVNKARTGGYRLRLSHWCEQPQVFLEQETDNRYRVVQVNEAAVRLARTIGKSGLPVPGEGRERVLALSRMMSGSVAVRTNFADAGADSKPGDPRPVVRLMPLDNGLKVSLHVRPFGEVGPYFPAGRGPRIVVASIKGSHQRAARKMREERKRSRALIDECSSLGNPDEATEEWVFDDLESSLQVMLELRNLKTRARIEWPENTPVPVPRALDSSRFRMAIRRERDWFALSAKVSVDEKLVVGMGELLDSLDRASGRFVPLDDGRFLALTESLRRQLERLKSLSSGRGKHGERVSPLGTLAIQDFLEETASLKSDKSWESFRDRVARAESHRPQVPGTLKADLRDYQREGFEWASRLATLGAGACLADDMGLGKTVQALALLLERGGDGPALVVAPTSVCPNWEAETRRFAPTLTCYRLGDRTDRKSMIGDMGAQDILIASYGMVSRNIEALGAVSWRTLIIDEAQAVKNPEARRTQAVCRLRADFRMALTGTPVENHLEELWSLFRILNPGLLGTRAGFRKRFLSADPDRSSDCRNDLRVLIRPFILRRTKSMVLSELPARTEQVIRIELDSEERAFHEALRRQAVERLEHLAETNPGKRRIRILSEITRLRRACCHPRLIDENSELPGAKLETLMNVVETIRAGRHKALVFSQFVGHLALVRPKLEAANIPYQYLDGATPTRQREERIRAFQSGEGDLFLISLRAGGTGLNLTAADYVLHLDPWWNPAVEDQASDRAHRIGQERPVTIYRLVVRHSIEEKILELHREKRELADELLAGTETATWLREDDLLNLIALP